MTPGIGGGYGTVPNITFINATYATQVNNLFGNSFIVNNNNVTSTLGTINMIIQATGSQTGNMLQFRNGAGSVLSGVDASGSLFINKTTANARLDVNGPTIISGSFTVFTGSAVELQVTNTGVRIGNVTTDVHTVTGSFNVSGSATVTGSIDITSVLNSHTITNNNSVSAVNTLRIVSANSTSSFTDRGLTISSAPGAFYDSRVDTIRGRADYFAGLRVNGVGETGSAAIPLWLMGQHPIYGVGSSYRFALVAFDGTNYNDIFNVTPSTFNVQVGGRTDAGYKFDVQGTLRNTTDAYLNTTSGNTSIGKTTANAKLDVNGPTIISGSFTVFTGSAVELQVTNTGVRIGNASTDTHTVTGSFNISGSGFVHGGGFIVSGTLATSGSTSQGLVAPLKFTTATANTNYTLVYTDEGKMVEMNNNADAPLLVTIPLNSSVPFPIGTEISIIQIGGGTTIITGSSGVTVYSSLGVKTLQNPYDVASVVKRGTDSWYLFGNLS